MKNNKTAPIILTSRLKIRFVDLMDANDYFIFCKDEDVTHYLSFNPYKNVKEAKTTIENMIRAYLNGTDVNFSLVLKGSNQVIGSISLTFSELDNSADVGFILNKEYWHQGYMDEALKGLISYAFGYYNLDYLEARFISENENSKKLLLKNNFKLTAAITDFKKNNIWFSVKHVKLTKEAFYEQNS